MSLPTVTVKTPLGRTINEIIKEVRSDSIVGTGDLKVQRTSRGSIVQIDPSITQKPTTFLNYKGEWDADAAYSLYDVVRVLHDTNYVADGGYGDLVNASPGVWVCVSPVPDYLVSKALKQQGYTSGIMIPYIRQDNVRYEPFWPEPDTVADANTPTGRYWELISLLPIESKTCVDGVQINTWADLYESGSATT